MADLKISALTASTVPLAGTEVLPIVQSGTTKQVSVANLTAGRAVSASQLSSTTKVSAKIATSGTYYRVYEILATGGTAIGEISYSDTNDTMRIANLSNYVNTSMTFYVNGSDRMEIMPNGDIKALNGNFVVSTSGKGITNSTGAVALNFSTAGTSLNSPQSVLSGSFPNVGSAQTITISDTNGGYVVITGVQGGIGSSTWTLPFAKRGGSIGIGTASKAFVTADPISAVGTSGGNITVTPVAGNTYFTYAIYYTPLGA